MTPPKLLTVDEIIELKKSYVLFGDVGDDLETLIETALAAMRVVEKAKFCLKYDVMPSEFLPLIEALKPFQQTGEDKGGRGDE